MRTSHREIPSDSDLDAPLLLETHPVYVELVGLNRIISCFKEEKVNRTQRVCFLCVQTYRSYLRTRVYSLGTATVYRAQRAGAGPSSRRSEAPPRSLSRGARTSRVERRCHASSAYRGRGLNFTKTLVITGQQAEGAAAGPLCNSMRAFGPGGHKDDTAGANKWIFFGANARGTHRCKQLHTRSRASDPACFS